MIFFFLKACKIEKCKWIKFKIATNWEDDHRVKVKHFSVENEIYVEFPLLKAVLSRWTAASSGWEETRNSENCL